MHIFWYSIAGFIFIIMVGLIYRFTRAMIAVRRGPQWYMCPISTCEFAFRHTGEDKEDREMTKDIMRDHILAVHYDANKVDDEPEV